MIGEIHFSKYKSELIKLLFKYHHVIALNDSELGLLNNEFYHNIKLTKDAKIIHKLPYRCPHSHNKQINYEVNSLLEQGVISPSDSPWSFPLLLVKKKDNSFRVVIDYRQLNLQTIPIRFPIPSISEALRLLRESKYFTSIDLKSGFHQVPLDPESRPYTAFSTDQGHFEFLRLPQGLKNSPSTFQSVMNSVLAGLSPFGIIVYLDDILIHSKNISDHFNLIEKTLKRFDYYGLTLSIKKSSFLRSELLYLGHIVSSEGIKPDPEKINKLSSWPIPKTIRQLRGYLGFAGYFRSFISYYSRISKPLTELTKITTKYIWTKECQKSFNELNEALLNAKSLVYPNFDKPFLVACDASYLALGACLMQRGEDNKIRPIEFASKTISDTQKNYPVIDLEAMAVDFALRKFRFIIFGYNITVLTDHKPLVALFNSKRLDELNPRMIRLVLRVQSYEPKVVYIEGKLNNVADYLSRNPCDKVLTCNVELKTNDTNLNVVFSINELSKHQTEDENIYKLILAVRNNSEIPSNLKIKDKTFVYRDKILYIKDNKDGELRYRIVVPEKLEQNVIIQKHSTYPYIHPGIDRTKKIIDKHYFIKNLSSKVKKFIEQCDICNACKGLPHKPVPYEMYPIANKPFDTVHMDYLGPFPSTGLGNKYLLVLIDYCTRFVIIIPTSNRTASTVALALFNNLFLPHSAPRTLVSDNALEFTSSVINELCKIYKTEKVEVTAYTPHANGVVERSNRSILQILRMLTLESSLDWDLLVPIVESAINSGYNSSIGDTPHFALFGYDKVTLLDPKSIKIPCYNDNSPKELYQIHQRILNKVANNLKEAQLEYTNKANMKAKPLNVQKGDRVFLKNVKTDKLSPPWVGPYRISNVMKHNRIELKNIKLTKHKPIKVHLNNVKIVKQIDADPQIISQARDIYPKLAENEEKELIEINEGDNELNSEVQVQFKQIESCEENKIKSLDPKGSNELNGSSESNDSNNILNDENKEEEPLVVWSPRKLRSRGEPVTREIPENSRI